MAGALTALGVYTGALASGASYDIRPPAGEVWIITTYNYTANHNLYWVNSAGGSNLSLGNVNGRWKPILHNSKLWLRFSADTGVGSAGYFFGFKVTEGDPYVPAHGKLDIPGSGSVEVRPAAGKVFVITDLILNDSGVSFRITNGTNDLTGGLSYTGSGAPYSHRKVVLTNSVWFKAVNTTANAQSGLLNGWEHPDTTVKPLVGITQTAGGVTEELAPPAGETWVMTHWSSGGWTFNIEGQGSLAHGNVAISTSENNSYARNLAISGTGSWARRTGDATYQYYMGFKI